MTLFQKTIYCAVPALALLAIPGAGQMKDNQERTLTCGDGNHWGGKRQRACEIKEQTLDAPKGAIQIDPGTNGGISVKGWNQPNVLVRARIETFAPTEGEARLMVSQIQFASGAAQLKASGPPNENERSWAVSYEVFVPHQTDIDARSHNGGIRIEDVKGRITFQALNGGTRLNRLAGDVSGQTTNGGLTIELAGDRWDGKGMDVQTTNGGVKVAMPANYSARVEAATVNGGVSSDFAAATQGRAKKEMSFTLGSGGATIRAVTTNGGVKIQRI